MRLPARRHRCSAINTDPKCIRFHSLVWVLLFLRTIIHPWWGSPGLPGLNPWASCSLVRVPRSLLDPGLGQEDGVPGPRAADLGSWVGSTLPGQAERLVLGMESCSGTNLLAVCPRRVGEASRRGAGARLGENRRAGEDCSVAWEPEAGGGGGAGGSCQAPPLGAAPSSGGPLEGPG